MLKSLINTNIFTQLNQDIKSPSHAYLFYGEDELLNVELAKIFIASIFCGKPACLQCEVCKRIELNKNPDLLIIDKVGLQVADIEGLIDNVQLKPMIYNYKVVLITNADTINETAQNKLLKTLEEPNNNVIFVLVCKNSERLLPTIKSRLNKHFVPNIDLSIVAEDLKNKGINIDKFLHCEITLTEAIKYSDNNNLETLDAVNFIILNLKTTSDIPKIVGQLKIKPEKRKELLTLLNNACENALMGGQGIVDKETINYLQANYNSVLLVKIMNLITNAYKMLESNVNFNYVLDYLFYQILKEKYLCK